MTPDLQRFRNDFVQSFQRIEKNTTPGDAQFLRILIEASGAKRGMEIGVATGYGAMVMGLGFEQTGGSLTSIDVDDEMIAIARSNLAKMQLQKVVTIVKGAALDVIPTLSGTFDFVFIDALKHEYLQYFKAIEPKLAAGAIIVADNVIQHADAMQDFLHTIKTDPQYQSVILRASDEKDDGMAVIYKSEVK